MAARAECTPGSPSLRRATPRHSRIAADFTTATPTRPRLRIPDVQARATSRPATSLPRQPRLHRCMAGMRAGIDIRTVRRHDIHGLPATSAPPRLPGCVYQRRAAHSQGDVPPPQAPASAVPRSVHPAASPARCGAGAPRIADMPGNRSPWQESKTTPVRRHFRHTPARHAEPLPAAWRPTSGMSPGQVARHLEALLVLETVAARFGGRCGIIMIEPGSHGVTLQDLLRRRAAPAPRRRRDARRALAAGKATGGASPDQVVGHLEAPPVVEATVVRFGGQCRIPVIDLDRTGVFPVSRVVPAPRHRHDARRVLAGGKTQDERCVNRPGRQAP